ncbi:MAG: hypothetical protein WCG26_01125 [Chloroflexales bacterium]
MTEDERRAIVVSGPVWLADGLRATIVGIMTPWHAGVSSVRPGFWACSWETAAEVVARPDRRFLPSDHVWKTRDGWLGLTPRPTDFQTPADYAAWQAKQG